MERHELLERYEALGDERDFRTAKRLYERALANAPDPKVLNEFGYLLECHGRSELRRALELYERAIEADPGYDEPHFQLISARAGLQEAELAVGVYEQRVADAPGAVREYRFLACAYLKVHAYGKAYAVAEKGLALVSGDAPLVSLRGEARAGLGDAEGALADWRRALALNPEGIDALYSSAFLLEQLGRLAEAIEAWSAIVDWNASRGYELENEWPKSELERLRRAQTAA